MSTQYNSPSNSFSKSQRFKSTTKDIPNISPAN